MSNFSPRIEDATNEQLLYMVNELNPHFTQLASDELTRRTIRDFEKTVSAFSAESTRQAKIILFLTWIMVIGLIVQIYVAL